MKSIVEKPNEKEIAQHLLDMLLNFLDAYLELFDTIKDRRIIKKTILNFGAFINVSLLYVLYNTNDGNIFDDKDRNKTMSIQKCLEIIEKNKSIVILN